MAFASSVTFLNLRFACAICKSEDSFPEMVLSPHELFLEVCYWNADFKHLQLDVCTCRKTSRRFCAPPMSLLQRCSLKN